jgi:demethylmenaquinone methyltransferase/2-methoxy-6-polyprenyl-1,4-benzoquinol methylase
MIQGDGTLLPLVRDSFDGVFLSFTLELFNDADMATALGECQRVLKSDGRLGVVSMAKQDVLACRLYEWGHAHWPAVLDCRPIKLREHLEAGGFRVQVLKVEMMWGLPVEIALGKPV